MKKLDIDAIFKSDADDLINAREKAIELHKTNIRTGGDEVELSAQNYLRRMLPSNYHISQGHIIDKSGNTSSQLDIIISDNLNLPSLITTKNNTTYIPFDSIYSVGEIKSTYYKSQNYIEKFCSTIKDIRENLYHPEIINTAYKGEIKGDTLLRDTFLGKNNKILNQTFFFMLFVSGGDFKFEDIINLYKNEDVKYLPNLVVILDKGIIFRASLDKIMSFNRYPEHPNNNEEEWYFSPIDSTNTGSMEGNHLSFLYYCLVEHLANSYLEPPSVKFLLNTMRFSKSNFSKLG